MAQVISTRNTAPAQNTRKTYGKKNDKKPEVPLFHTINYILMAIGALLLAIGYITLTGGASDDPSHFSEAIFDTRRLVVAPILMLAGLVTGIFAIMWTPCKKKTADRDTTTEQPAE